MSIFLGCLTSAVVLFQKFVFGDWVHRNPLLLISIFFLLVGFQFILMGLLAEIMIRVYHESAKTRIYWISEKINFEEIPASHP